MNTNLTDSQKFDYLISLLPEDMQYRMNAPQLISVDQLKEVVFSYQNASQDGATFKNFKKIDGGWHAFKKDGSMFGYGLSRPRKDVERQYIASLPAYEDFVKGDAYFTNA